MIGLAGSHRTGKTTLAKAWAEKEGVEYVPVNVSDVIQGTIGDGCSSISSMDQRLLVQRRLVEHCAETFLRRKTLFVTDRTPLDVAAYTMADVTQHMTPAQSKEVVSIIEDCIHLTNSCFQSILLVQPGIPYEPEPGKPPVNKAYQQHIHLLVEGLLFDERTTVQWWFVPGALTSLEDRLDCLDLVHEGITEESTFEAESAVLN